eukprot:TRINITY_DN3247_c0_g1_i1.p1 TRINITY_DN3247_c0_g1~~TRINITY_DN3247_c0_g1_i1.p1  ORF type:complete len:199 (-),score=82.81 TRINITY_DN3247_c0_g1_i1:57-584(-)
MSKLSLLLFACIFLVVCQADRSPQTRTADFWEGVLNGILIPAPRYFNDCLKSSNFNEQLVADASTEILKNEKTDAKFKALGAAVTEIGRILGECTTVESSTLSRISSIGQHIKLESSDIFVQKEKYGVVTYDLKNDNGDASLELFGFALNWKDGKGFDSASSLMTMLNDIESDFE